MPQEKANFVQKAKKGPAPVNVGAGQRSIQRRTDGIHYLGRIKEIFADAFRMLEHGVTVQIEAVLDHAVALIRGSHIGSHRADDFKALIHHILIPGITGIIVGAERPANKSQVEISDF